MLGGRHHPLQLGYFCIRQQDEAQRSKRITVAEARALETHFFASIPPWTELSLKDRSRLGMANLKKSISKYLAERRYDSCVVLLYLLMYIRKLTRDIDSMRVSARGGSHKSRLRAIKQSHTLEAELGSARGV